MHVERHGADGAELLVFVQRRLGHGGAFVVGDHAAPVAHAVQLLAACVGREEEGLDHLHAAGAPRTGWRTWLTPAMAPAASVAPSITAASSSCVSSCVNTAP